jgi:hypothetical protein
MAAADSALSHYMVFHYQIPRLPSTQFGALLGIPGLINLTNVLPGLLSGIGSAVCSFSGGTIHQHFGMLRMFLRAPLITMIGEVYGPDGEFET